MLISPSVFDPTIGEKYRGRDNVMFCSGIWIDVDEGEMSYKNFQTMFSGKKMVIYNTARSTDDTRYRAFFPTSEYMDADT